MHPSRNFRWTDRDQMLAFARDHSFAHVFVQSPSGPLVAHVPVLVSGDALLFHLAKSNSLAGALDGATALASISGADGYISPDWYGTPNQVPTWNYIAVEVVGTVIQLPDAELARLVEDLSAHHEEKLHPKPPWTRKKMDARLFRGMLKAIVGFELQIEQIRGTLKLGQNKTNSEQDSVATSLGESGNAYLAAAMRQIARGRREHGG